MVACEQALLGALAAGQEKERELATITLEFEFLHRKSHCKMLIGGDDISNDIITLGTCFSMIFFHIRAHFRFALMGGNLTAQSMGSHSGRDVVASPPSFSRPAARAPWRACSQATNVVSSN